ncbi:MAG: hypothetical protein AAFU56_02235 [Pseudomonadota bacterium]
MQHPTKRSEYRASAAALTTLAGFATAALCGVLIEIVDEVADIEASALLRDPAAVYDVPAVAGAVSFIGIALVLATFRASSI